MSGGRRWKRHGAGPGDLSLAVVVALFAYVGIELVGASVTAGLRLVMPRPRASEAEPRTFQILAINDVYRIEGLPESDLGGLARLRTLRAAMEEESDVLVLHAGDFLYPSLLSNEYDGEQMIDVLNVLDGDSVRFDERFVVTFGNHEFDRRDGEGAEILLRRIDESEFNWLGTDLTFGPDSDTLDVPAVRSPNLVRSRLLSVGGVWVGIFSLTLMPGPVTYLVSDSLDANGEERIARARAATRALRDEGAELVIGLTHLPMGEDLAILEALGPDGPDLIVGGHEHDRRLERRRGRYVVKADADARTAAIVTVRMDEEEGPLIEARYAQLGAFVAPDSAVASRARRWLDRLDVNVCDTVGCLNEELGRTAWAWDGEETRIRARETMIGNWMADRILEALSPPPDGAEAVLINSGSIRLNQDVPRGAPIRRRLLEELIEPYDNGFVVLSLAMPTLRAALERSVSCRGEGAWLVVGGLAFGVDATGNVDRLEVGGRPPEEDAVVRVAVPRFLADPALGNQDGYIMLDMDQVHSDPGLTTRNVIAPLIESGARMERPALGRVDLAALASPGECVVP